MYLHALPAPGNWRQDVPAQDALGVINSTAHCLDRKYGSATRALDDGVGNITGALKSTGMYEDTIVWFSSDNGGPTNHNEGTYSDNYPMRGVSVRPTGADMPSFPRSHGGLASHFCRFPRFALHFTGRGFLAAHSDPACCCRF